MKKTAAIATALIFLAASIVVATVDINPTDVLVNGVSVALDPDVAAVQGGVNTNGTAITALDARVVALEGIDVTQLQADVNTLLIRTALLPDATCFKLDPDHGGVPKIMFNAGCGDFKVVDDACFNDDASPSC